MRGDWLACFRAGVVVRQRLAYYHTFTVCFLYIPRRVTDVIGSPFMEPTENVQFDTNYTAPEEVVGQTKWYARKREPSAGSRSPKCCDRPSVRPSGSMTPPHRGRKF